MSALRNAAIAAGILVVAATFIPSHAMEVAVIGDKRFSQCDSAGGVPLTDGAGNYAGCQYNFSGGGGSNSGDWTPSGDGSPNTDKKDTSVSKSEAPSPADDTCTTGRPVVIPTGNKVLPELDFFLSVGDPASSIRRSYSKSSNHIGIFGEKWTSNLEHLLSFEYGSTVCNASLSGVAPCSPSQPLTKIYASFGYGYAFQFVQDAAGVWRSTDGSVIAQNGAGWRITRPAGGVEDYDSNGRPLTVNDERGIGFAYSYNAGNQLSTITHTSGRSITFTWSGTRAVAIIAPNGKAYGYGYNASGYLPALSIRTILAPALITMKIRDNRVG